MTDRYLLGKIVSEEKLKEIYDQVGSHNVFLSSKNIHLMSAGELKTYDRNANLISTNILGIGNACFYTSGDYMILGEKDGRKIFLFEKGKLKWEREVDSNIERVYVNKLGKVVCTGYTSMYNSVITLIDENGLEYLKRYFTNKYASKSVISENNKYLVIALADYTKLNIYSEIEMIDLEKAKKDENATIKTYYKDQLILDISIGENEEILAKYIDSIYLVNKNEEKKVYDISNEILFLTLNKNGGFSEIIETKSNLISTGYELKIYDNLGSNISTYILSELPKNLKSKSSNILIEYPQSILVLSEYGTLKKKYSSKRNFVDVKVSDELIAIIFIDKISIIPI